MTAFKKTYRNHGGIILKHRRAAPAYGRFKVLAVVFLEYPFPGIAIHKYTVLKTVSVHIDQFRDRGRQVTSGVKNIIFFHIPRVPLAEVRGKTAPVRIKIITDLIRCPVVFIRGQAGKKHRFGGIRDGRSLVRNIKKVVRILCPAEMQK